MKFKVSKYNYYDVIVTITCDLHVGISVVSLGLHNVFFNVHLHKAVNS